MCIHTDARLSISHRNHQVRRLAAHTFELKQAFDCIRHDAGKLPHQAFADRLDRARLRFVEADGINRLFNGPHMNLCKIAGRICNAEQPL